jgi:hypothetical protein
MAKRFLVLALLAAAVLTPTASAARGGSIFDLVQAYIGTAKYLDLSRAQADGYTKLLDTQGIACIDEPGMGAMGIHYVKGAFVGDPNNPDTVLDPARPEAVVYEPQRNGKQRLVALEYVVFQDAWDAAHSSPPSLFGQQFMLTPSPNRFGLPAFYSLHAWIWKQNPSGLFAMWNPQVHCP